MMAVNWFTHSKVKEGLYLIVEPHFIEDNRCNCWLIKGPSKDVLIDTGIGVCNMRQYLEEVGLIDAEGRARPCEVILTHAHFDHSGGAHNFSTVFAHSEDSGGIIRGRQVETLNFVKPSHFVHQPYPEFNAHQYKVPPTPCQSLKDGDLIDIGGGDYLEILHTPGHTPGSISLYSPSMEALFTGDFVYDCGHGGNLLDWLPNSSVSRYVQTAERMLDFLSDHSVGTIYPGHFGRLSSLRVDTLLSEYIDARDGCSSRTSASCLQGATWCYFLLGCFRCYRC